jgi:aminoglycoside 3-N-acetyltransferase
MPTFTYQCMVYPLVGPLHNGMTYTDHERENAEAEIFTADTPAHADMGIVAETLRRMHGVVRSTHPLLSFAAAGAEAAVALAEQTPADPFAPIRWLVERSADVLLLGVNHIVNTSIHYGEQRAGRKPFVRWALTAAGAVECPNWPSCSAGFEALAPHLQKAVRVTQIGEAHVQRVPVRLLVEAAERLVRADPLALLCNRVSCERCGAIRAANNPLALVR